MAKTIVKEENNIIKVNCGFFTPKYVPRGSGKLYKHTYNITFRNPEIPQYHFEYKLEYYATSNVEMTQQDYVNKIKDYFDIGQYQNKQLNIKQQDTTSIDVSLYISLATYGNRHLEMYLYNTETSGEDGVANYTRELYNQAVEDLSIFDTFITVTTVSIEEV